MDDRELDPDMRAWRSLAADAEAAAERLLAGMGHDMKIVFNPDLNGQSNCCCVCQSGTNFNACVHSESGHAEDCPLRVRFDLAKKLLEASRPEFLRGEPLLRRDGIVYFIRAENSERIKIGWTANDAEIRRSALQTGSPQLLSVLATFPASREEEKLFHAAYAWGRTHGEWFELPIMNVIEIEEWYEHARDLFTLYICAGQRRR